MTIAFIGFGEAGGILAADLAREHVGLQAQWPGARGDGQKSP